MIPLIIKLKKVMHKEIATAQDIIMEELYKVFDDAVIHGGTSIWRCYGGNRFSEDIDAYIPKSREKIKVFFENLKRKGFVIKKEKVTERSIYSNMAFNRVDVRFEATFKKISGVLKEYEKADGTYITVYTLSPEELINEKVSAYLGRRKVRDIYDIFFLLRYVKRKENVSSAIGLLVKNARMPVDEEELKILILEGIVPTTEKMISYIKQWVG